MQTTETATPQNDTVPPALQPKVAAPAKQRRFGRKPVGGVAPLVGQPSRWTRWRTNRQLASRGFVALSPGRPKLRHRILPRSVLGISAMLMSAGIGAAFSGAAFYAYYDDRLAQNEAQVATFVDGFEAQFNDAAGAIDEMRVEAISEIRAEMGPVAGYAADQNGVVELPQQFGSSVWALETLNGSGDAAFGTAFAVLGHNGGTILVTSYDLVSAATIQPGPAVTLSSGEERLSADVYSWDQNLGVALLWVNADLPKMKLATANQVAASVGDRVFAMSGIGSQGATASPGILLDASANGLQHTASVGTLFAGGPIVTGEGLIIGIAALTYNPLGVDTGQVPVAASVVQLCNRLVRCAEVGEDVTVEVEDGALDDVDEAATNNGADEGN